MTVKIGAIHALDNLTCCVHDGEFLAVTGPNGAGKSTLLKAILGLLEPASGAINVFGHLPKKVLPGWIGYVPQVKTLDRSFPAIVLEVVITGLKQTWIRKISDEDRNLAMNALNLIRAGHLADRPVSRLSGGELQRVYLARSLVRKPRLILLDEPVTGVDTIAEADYYQLLQEYMVQTRATIIMVTHDWEVAAKHAARVMVLNRRLISLGDPHEALCDECIKEAYSNPASSKASGSPFPMLNN